MIKFLVKFKIIYYKIIFAIDKINNTKLLNFIFLKNKIKLYKE